HAAPVGDGDGAEAELLEQLVGERPRRPLGQAAPELRQRRGQKLEHRRPAPLPAPADQHSSTTSGSVEIRRPVQSRTSGHGGSRPGGTNRTGVIPTRSAPPSSSFAPSPTNSAPAG